MQLTELLLDKDGEASHLDVDGTLEILGITSDSRAVKPGFLFAALPGEKVDGCSFISSAVEKGAAAILAPIGTTADVPVIEDLSPRARLSQMAANFYGQQPELVAAITGTNGKTSVASFLRQIWQHVGLTAASLGTLGVQGAGFDEPGTLTTLDPVQLHETVKRLADAGVDHLVVEASSHGLEQHRLDGLRIHAAGFTNISRDHLDYHGTMENYLAAKLRLFDACTQPTGIAVINANTTQSDAVISCAHARGLDVMTYGRDGDDIRLLFQIPNAKGQQLMLLVDEQSYDVQLPLAGAFQVENALCALGLAIALGVEDAVAVEALEHLTGVAGRLQYIGSVGEAQVYVDFAHTPDALKNVLQALRPHARHQLHVMFGCGGDRDAGKRPEMGAVATELADVVMVTDDNPRTENADDIRKQILAKAPGAAEIGDRHLAIKTAIANLSAGDVLVLAGKGHEQGQKIGNEVLPFDDVEEALNAISNHKDSALVGT